MTPNPNYQTFTIQQFFVVETKFNNSINFSIFMYMSISHFILSSAALCFWPEINVFF
jgi:hypothetical protein